MNEFKFIIIVFGNSFTLAIDSTEHQKAGSENDDSKASVVAASVSVLGQFDSEVSLENYFKSKSAQDGFEDVV